MSCTFYNLNSEFSIESQVKDYILTVIESGEVAVQQNQVTCLCSPEQADIFANNICSDIHAITSSFPSGNREFYSFKTVTIVIYKVYNG